MNATAADPTPDPDPMASVSAAADPADTGPGTLPDAAAGTGPGSAPGTEAEPAAPFASGGVSGAPRRATFGFMVRHPARWMAIGFGSGLSPKAPGTVGSLWGWASFLVLNHWLSPALWAGVIVASLVVGWWACTTTARHMQVSDPGAVVWDEIVAVWLILWLLMPASFLWQLGAFAVFRYFDAAKPGPVRWADGLFKVKPGAPIGWAQGFGILFDDLVAAGCTLLVLAAVRWLLT